MDVDEFVAVCCAKPAIHRFPGAMGRRDPRAVHRARRRLRRSRPRTRVGATSDGGRRAVLAAARAARVTATRSRRSSSPSSARRRASRPEGWQDAAGKFGDDVAAFGRRHRRPRVVGEGPRVEASAEGRPARQAGPPAPLTNGLQLLKLSSSGPPSPSNSWSVMSGSGAAAKSCAGSGAASKVGDSTIATG